MLSGPAVPGGSISFQCYNYNALSSTDLYPITAEVYLPLNADPQGSDCTTPLTAADVKGKVVLMSAWQMMYGYCNFGFSSFGVEFVSHLESLGAVGVISWIQQAEMAAAAPAINEQRVGIPVCYTGSDPCSFLSETGVFTDGSCWTKNNDGYMMKVTVGKYVLVAFNGRNETVQSGTLSVEMTADPLPVIDILDTPAARAIFVVEGVLNILVFFFALYTLVLVIRKKPDDAFVMTTAIVFEGLASTSIRAVRNFAFQPGIFRYNFDYFSDMLFAVLDLPPSVVATYFAAYVWIKLGFITFVRNHQLLFKVFDVVLLLIGCGLLVVYVIVAKDAALCFDPSSVSECFMHHWFGRAGATWSLLRPLFYPVYGAVGLYFLGFVRATFVLLRSSKASSATSTNVQTLLKKWAGLVFFQICLTLVSALMLWFSLYHTTVMTNGGIPDGMPDQPMFEDEPSKAQDYYDCGSGSCYAGFFHNAAIHSIEICSVANTSLQTYMFFLRC